MEDAYLCYLSTLRAMTEAWLKNALRDNGKTQNDLAKALGISHTQISKAMKGNRQFQIRELVPAANCLGISVDELLAGLGLGSAYKKTSQNNPKLTQDMRIAFLERLYTDSVLVPGAELNTILNELDRYCEQETDTLKLGIKVGELFAKAKSTSVTYGNKPAPTKNKNNFKEIVTNALNDALKVTESDMAPEAKARLIELATLYYSQEPEGTDIKETIHKIVKEAIY